MVTQGHYICSGAEVLRPSYRLRIEGCRTASVLAPEIREYKHHLQESRIASVLARKSTLAQQQGAQAQPTDMAQQFAQMMRALAQGQKQRATAEAHGTSQPVWKCETGQS